MSFRAQIIVVVLVGALVAVLGVVGGTVLLFP